MPVQPLHTDKSCDGHTSMPTKWQATVIGKPSMTKITTRDPNPDSEQNVACPYSPSRQALIDALTECKSTCKNSTLKNKNVDSVDINPYHRRPIAPTMANASCELMVS